MLKIYQVTTQEHIDFAKHLFLEYLEFLREEFDEYRELPWLIEYFEAFEKEIDGLPGDYSPPVGCILIVEYKTQPIGCVALKGTNNNTCEMKRLYIKTQYHRRGIGTVLCKALIEKAITMNYTHMRLATALEVPKYLYKSLGFTEIPPFDHAPVDGIMFMELKLRQIC